MAMTIATITADGLKLPLEFMAEQSLQPGAMITIVISESHRPLRTATDEFFQSMRGILSSDPGLLEELQQQRRQDDRRTRSKW